MKTEKFLGKLDEARIVSAIAQAEEKTSGQIRVFVSEKAVDDPLAHAKARFLKLGMEKTAARNAVLIYFAPISHKFAVIGDTAVHEKCGDAFWQQLSETMRQALREELFTDAIVLAVERCGALLAAHFPPDADQQEQLPNEVEGD